MTDTRERFIEAATSAFAERGFHGTSIAAIAEPLPYTKQALLHHFGSKEKLYGEVLKRISERLTGELEAIGKRFDDPRQRLEETMVAFYRSSMERRDETRLLLRELLDNQRRAETARTWYLKPFLETLAEMVECASAGAIHGRASALAVAYQLLGALTYFVVSAPTLSRMFGKQEFARLRAGYEQELRHLIAARLQFDAAA